MTQNTHPTYKDPKPLGNGKVAVVTGASTGIGEATVRRLRESGWTVYAVARRAERLEELVLHSSTTSPATRTTLSSVSFAT